MAAETMETPAAAAAAAAANRNRAIVSALCSRFSLDPNKFTSESIRMSDIMSLFTNILHLPASEIPLKNQPELIKWVEFASKFPTESEACHATLRGLNEDLAQKTVLLGHGFHPSEADIVVFPALHAFVSHLSEAEKQKYPNVIRWMDYIQQKEDFGGLLAKIVVNKPGFEHFDMYVENTDVDQISKKVSAASKDVARSNKNINSVKGAAEEKVSVDDKTVVDSKQDITDAREKKPAVDIKKDVKGTKEKKKQPEKESSEKDAESSVTILNIQVGRIHKAWKHPSADSLLVEEIDLGDGNLRQVVSGLAKYCTPEELTNHRVVLITNVKPGKLRDVMSAGLVLCASSEDYSVVEPLIPPERAIIGERITFSGYEGKPEDVLNPKKKQLEKITPISFVISISNRFSKSYIHKISLKYLPHLQIFSTTKENKKIRKKGKEKICKKTKRTKKNQNRHLYTDDKGIATYKGVPFMTSAGPCTSSISNAGIK